jgi:hypothetical protein
MPAAWGIMSQNIRLCQPSHGGCGEPEKPAKKEKAKAG